MGVIVEAVVPLFAVIFLGYGAGRRGLLSDTGIRELNTFVLYIALPPLLFRAMARAPLNEINDWRMLGGYIAVEVAVFLLAVVLGWRWLRRPGGEVVVQGFGAVFANGVFITLPLMQSLHGEAGVLPVLLIITWDGIAVFIVGIVLMESVAGEGRASVAMVARSVFTHPVIMALLTGLLYGWLDGPIPTVVDRTLVLLGQATAPAALFGLGAALSVQTLGRDHRPLVLMVVLKLAFHPLLTWLLLKGLPGLPPLWLQAAVINAAMPCGAMVYVLAQRYRSGVALASTAVLVSTLLGLFTVSGWVWWVLPAPS